MSIRDEKNIKILNLNETNLCVKTNIRDFVIPYGTIEEPTFEYVTFEEIVYINSNTNGIKSGLIRFEKDKEDEIYKELGINPDTIIRNEDIENILLNPSEEGLDKLISIKDASIIKRIRCMFTRLKNTNANMSMQTINIIEQRIREVKNGTLISKMQIHKSDVVKSNETENLKSEIEQLKAMIAQLTSANVMTENKIENNSDETSVEIKKKGRRKKED